MASIAQLEFLPPELIEHILDLLPDVTSLLSSILTCSSLYRVFIRMEVPIISKVVRNVMSQKVLLEAVATLESSRVEPWSDGLLQNFDYDRLRSREGPHSSWTLSKALSLANLHRHVEYFTADFASQSLARLRSDSDSNTALSRSLSSSELCRIQCAFYRFEMFCNLFRSRETRPLIINEQHPAGFFLKSSPWEHEQLGCINDYLFYRISPAFNEITDHDVAWGALGITEAYDLDDGHMQHVLSLGLAKLHDTAAAASYDERRRIFYEPCPDFEPEFLLEGSRLANELSDWYNIRNTLSDYERSTTGNSESLYTAFKSVPHTGPMEARRWAHQESTGPGFVYAHAHHWLRERGYVFWDHSRLDAWSVFQSPYEPPATTVADAERASRAASERAWEDTRGRCNRRAQIYKAGGRGWWSLEDESKVVYPPAQSPPPHSNRGEGKTSQQAADEYQRKLAQGDVSSEARPSLQTWKPRVPVSREERQGWRTPQWGS